MEVISLRLVAVADVGACGAVEFPLDQTNSDMLSVRSLQRRSMAIHRVSQHWNCSPSLFPLHIQPLQPTAITFYRAFNLGVDPLISLVNTDHLINLRVL